MSVVCAGNFLSIFLGIIMIFRGWDGKHEIYDGSRRGVERIVMMTKKKAVARAGVMIFILPSLETFGEKLAASWWIWSGFPLFVS